MFRINYSKKSIKPAVVAAAQTVMAEVRDARKQARADAQRKAEIARIRHFQNDCITLLNWAADTYDTGASNSRYFNPKLSREYTTQAAALNDLGLRVSLMKLSEFKRWYTTYSDDLDNLYDWLVFVTGEDWPR